MAVGSAGTAAFTVTEMSSPRITPTTPPMLLKVAASTRNWPTTSRRRAPQARRTPISRVLCVTETSMMFMTPTPPMTSEMRATKTMAPVMPPVMARNCEMSWSGVTSAQGGHRPFDHGGHVLRPLRHDVEVDAVPLRPEGELPLEGRVGHDHLVVGREAELRPLLLQHADDAVAQALDRDVLTDGILLGEEGLLHFASQYRDQRVA